MTTRELIVLRARLWTAARGASDAEYDAIVDRLAAFDRAYPWIASAVRSAMIDAPMRLHHP